jgi:hypothetical protein
MGAIRWRSTRSTSRVSRSRGLLYPSAGRSCGARSIVGVTVGTAQGTTAVATSAGELRDVDYLNLCCRTATAPLDSARCAVAVDPAIAGCGRALPAIVARRFTNARAALAHAVVNPERAHADVRRATSCHEPRASATGQRLARNNQCGDTLALIASHALDGARLRRRTVELAREPRPGSSSSSSAEESACRSRKT